MAQQVAGQLAAAIAAQGVARLALSGGSSPRAFLRVLDTMPLAWDKVRVTLVDERQVPPDHPRANWRFVRECLPQASQQAQWLPLYDPQAGEAGLLQTAQALQAAYLPLDVVVLGMGEDGHFASLFPDAAELAHGLAVTSQEVLLAIHAPSAGEARVSLTLATLLQARHLHLLLQGERKWQVWQAAQAGDRTLPVANLLQAAGDKIFVHYCSHFY